MKRNMMIGIFGLVLLLGAGMVMALTPPPALTPVGPVPPPPGTKPGPSRPVLQTTLPPQPSRMVVPQLGEAPPLPPSPGTEIPEEKEAERAVAAARQVVRLLTPGPVWTRRGPAGEAALMRALLYQGKCVVVVSLDPATGRPLPMGCRPLHLADAARGDGVGRFLPPSMEALQALNGAEFLDRENGWAVPLAYHGEIVAHLRIARDGNRVMPDYPAEQEMRAFGK